MAITAATQEPADVQVDQDQDEDFAGRQGLRPWRAVAEMIEKRHGEPMNRCNAERIGRTALAKMRTALRLMGVGPGELAE